MKVKKIKGNWPIYGGGDPFMILEGYKLGAGNPICMYSLASIVRYYVVLSRRVLPKELGLSAEDRNVTYV